MEVDCEVNNYLNDIQKKCVDVVFNSGPEK